MIEQDHALLPLVMDCLYYQDDKRPSSEEICQRLADLKTTAEYKDSIEQTNCAQTISQIKEIQLREARAIQELNVLQYEIQRKDFLLQEKERQIQQLRLRIQEHEHIIADILDQQTNFTLQKRMKQLQQLNKQDQQQQSGQDPTIHQIGAKEKWMIAVKKLQPEIVRRRIAKEKAFSGLSSNGAVLLVEL